DLVEDVVVLAQGEQFRSVGQLLQPRAHDPGFGSELIQGFAAIEFDVVDVVPVDPAQILGDPVHVVHRVPHSSASDSSFALDFHNRQTGTMSSYAWQEALPITSSSAGQPPMHAL